MFKISPQGRIIITFVTVAAIIAVAVGVVIAVFGQSSSEKGKDEPVYVAFVDGEGIDERELMLHIYKNRADTISYFYNTYGAKMGKDFWDTAHDGITPREHLMNVAIEAAVVHKTEQIMMKEKGIAEDITYEKFLSELIEENERRLEAVADREPIYGPEQYTEQSYYEYVHNNRRLKLIAEINMPLYNAVNYTTDAFDEALKQKRDEVKVEIIYEQIDNIELS